MDLANLAIDLVIALWVLAVIVAARRAWRVRVPRLNPLDPERQEVYKQAWQQVAAGFVHVPNETVRQADALVMALLRERGHPLDHERLPRQMIEARRSRLTGEKRGETEPLRIALLNYRSVFNDALGRQNPERTPEGRPQMA